MVDNLSREKRSKVMASIKGKNTFPELTIRKLVWASGKRYRVHDRSVFGIPDISSKGKKVAIFIDGCFWHGCERCYKEPTTNVSFWRSKVARNRERRSIVISELKGRGWKVLTYWEHQILNDPVVVANQIARFL